MSGTIIYIHPMDDTNKIVSSYYTNWEEDGETINQFLAMTNHTLVKEDWDNGAFEIKNKNEERFKLSLAYIDEFTQIS